MFLEVTTKTEESTIHADSTVTDSELYNSNPTEVTETTALLKSSTSESISKDVKRKKRQVDIPDIKLDFINVGSTNDPNISTMETSTTFETTSEMSTIDLTTYDVSSTIDTIMTVSPLFSELSSIQNEQINTTTMQTEKKTSKSNELTTKIDIELTTINILSTTVESTEKNENTSKSSAGFENILTDSTTPTSTDAILTTGFSTETYSSLNTDLSTTSSEITSTDLSIITTDLNSKMSTDIPESTVFNQSSTTPINNKGNLLKFHNI